MLTALITINPKKPAVKLYLNGVKTAQHVKSYAYRRGNRTCTSKRTQVIHFQGDLDGKRLADVFSSKDIINRAVDLFAQLKIIVEGD